MSLEFSACVSLIGLESIGTSVDRNHMGFGACERIEGR